MSISEEENKPKNCPYCGHNELTEISEISISVKTEEGEWFTLTEFICRNEDCGRSFYV